MDVTLSISSDDLSDNDLQALTRSLCMTLNSETDVQAEIVEQAGGQGTRGVEMVVGLIALFITSGSAVAALNVLKSYFERNSSFKVELTRQDGETLKIEAQNLNSRQMNQTVERAVEFLERRDG